ncbi:MAG: hypothetical protein LBS31_11280 [Candidatus Adiutrix sp.]|jgi:hypothetical protein|nr:hypothetical protein [Candidatus Adiutrix sp.]
MAGLIDECLLHLSRDLEAKTQTPESPQYKNQEKSARPRHTLIFLRRVAQTRDIHVLLDVERLALEHTLKYDTNSPEEKQSVTVALDQLDTCRKCFDSLMNNPAGYRENVDPTYSSKAREAGLPLDAAKEFFKSHATRLTNNLVSKASHVEKLLLRQRKENVAVMRECYAELQQKALGIASPKKSKGLSR